MNPPGWRSNVPALSSSETEPMNFADRLKQLPSAAHLTYLQVLGADGAVLATLENKPGQAGSLALRGPTRSIRTRKSNHAACPVTGSLFE